MDLDAKIYVAGHCGLVGSAIVRALRREGFQNLLLKSRSELDLRDQASASRFFSNERPAHVFLAAARVGGILANNAYPAEFIFDNLAIHANVIHGACMAGAERLLFLGSSCIYPKFASQPLKEEYLLSGPLEATNRPYSVAKIAGIEMCWAYNRQYNARFLASMPTNLYGPHDNYDLETSHVIPALLRKMHEAKMADKREVVLWGTGMPKREFLYSDDLADACVFLMNLDEDLFLSLVRSDAEPPLINIGCGHDITIRELAELIADIIGFHGMLKFDPGMPDGTPRKLLDISKLQSLGWKPKTLLREGLQFAYRDFLAGLDFGVNTKEECCRVDDPRNPKAVPSSVGKI